MNIEEIFKSSLDNSEMPFDPKAWEAMSARLDQAMPVSNVPKTGGSNTWAWVASVAVVAGISAFFLVNRETEATVAKQQVTIAKPSETQAAATKDQNKATQENEAAASAQVSSNAPADAASSGKTANNTAASSSSKANDPSKSGTGTTSGSSYGTASGTSKTGPTPDKVKDAKPFTFLAPVVDSRYCEGEDISIKNPNDYSLRLVSESGNVVYNLNSGKPQTISVSEAGDYYFTYQKNGKMEKESAFKVQPKPKADFYADEETLYEKGLPVNELKAANPAKEYTWMNSRGEVLSKDKQFNAHLFTKGQHEITLKVENANGCTSQVTKPVRCETSYNLLAVTGFDPESSNSKNNTFIPYALLERNTPFEMEIIDPKTGQTVYRTKDADQPWDGIDMITKQMAPSGSTYIWRVTIHKKEAGEPKNVYQGTITRI